MPPVELSPRMGGGPKATTTASLMPANWRRILLRMPSTVSSGPLRSDHGFRMTNRVATLGAVVWFRKLNPPMTRTSRMPGVSIRILFTRSPTARVRSSAAPSGPWMLTMT